MEQGLTQLSMGGRGGGRRQEERKGKEHLDIFSYSHAQQNPAENQTKSGNM